MGIYYIPRDDYLMHHGVKGQKWGVRHDPERIGRRRSGLTTANDVNQKRGLSKGAKVALGVGGAALAVGAGYALYKTGGAKAATQLGGRLIKTALQKSKSAAPKIAKVARNGLQKGSVYARATSKVAGKYAKKGATAATRYAISAAKKGATLTGNAVKKVANNTVKGVFDGIKGGLKTILSYDNVKTLVNDNLVKGFNTAAAALITGGIAVGAQSMYRGGPPPKEVVISNITRNPNKQ